MLGCCRCGSILSVGKIITLVNLLPSGSQSVLIARIFIGKKRFSINLFSVVCASTNQTLLWNSSSNFFVRVGFERIMPMSPPDKAKMKSPSILDAEVIVNLLISWFLCANFVIFIAPSTSASVSSPDCNLVSHFAHNRAVLASKVQIGVFNYFLTPSIVSLR